MYGTGSFGSFQLQSALSSGTSGSPLLGDRVAPHHPITCSGDLFFGDDGSFACEHVEVPADDVRTQMCLNGSLAFLLIELASAL